MLLLRLLCVAFPTVDFFSSPSLALQLSLSLYWSNIGLLEISPSFSFAQQQDVGVASFSTVVGFFLPLHFLSSAGWDVWVVGGGGCSTMMQVIRGKYENHIVVIRNLGINCVRALGI